MSIIEATETDFPGLLVFLKYIYDALVSISNVYRIFNASQDGTDVTTTYQSLTATKKSQKEKWNE